MQLPNWSDSHSRAFNTDEASYVDLGADFYLLSYDVNLSGIAPSSCLTIRGEIKRLGSKPVMVVARAAPPADCATGQARGGVPLVSGEHHATYQARGHDEVCAVIHAIAHLQIRCSRQPIELLLIVR